MPTILFAQGLPMQNSAPVEVEEVAPVNDAVTGSPVVADINIYDIEVTKDEAGVIAGDFSITASMGQQNNIAYGIIVVNEAGDLVSASRVGVIPTLKQGQVEKLSFSSPLPVNLSGNLSIVLLAENETGLLLSYRELVKKTLPANSVNLSCLRDESLSDTVNCASKTTTKLTVSYSTSMLGEKTVAEVRPVSQDEKVNFSPLTKPGRYFVSIANEDNEQVLVQLAKEGSYGEIKNIAIYQKEDNSIEAVIPVYGSGLKDSSLSLKLTNPDGTVCDEFNQVMTIPVFTFTLKPTCSAGTVTAEFKSGTGELLNAKTEPFSIATVEATNSDTDGLNNSSVSPKTTRKTKSNNNPLFILALFVIIAGGIFMVLKKRKVPPEVMMLLLFTALSLVPLKSAQAVTLFPYVFSNVNDEYAWMSQVDVSLGSGGPFVPGQVTTLNVAANIRSDRGATVGSTGSSNVHYFLNSAATAPSFDGAPVGSGVAIASKSNTPNDQNWHFFSGSVSITIPTGMSVGSHYISSIRATAAGGCITAPNPPLARFCTVNSPVFTTLPFTVSAPAASVQLNFQ